MKNKKEKQIAMLLATGLIAGNFPATIVNAKTNMINENLKSAVVRAADQDNIEVVYTLTLSSGKEIRAIKDESDNIILQELQSPDKWINKETLGEVLIEEMTDNNDGSYNIVYISNNFKYKQVFSNDSVKVGTEEMIGINIAEELEDGTQIALELDLTVDKAKNKTTLKTKSGDFIVEEFVPVLADFLGNKQIIIIGENSKKETSILIITESGKVINGEVIKNAKYLSSEYTEIKSLGLAALDNEKFLISGYAVKSSEPNKKDGFLIQFDGAGNRDSEVKIIPSSHSSNNDASINYITAFSNGNILIKGANLDKIYLNSLNYIDNRTVKDTLSINHGKTYRIVEETVNARSGNNNLKTFTLKGINDMFEYDINTYTNVQDIKLVPGNENQILVAIQKDDNSTEVDIINSANDIEIKENGDIVSKVLNGGKLQNDNGPILNININNIKVNNKGQISVTAGDDSTPIDVTINNVQAGNPTEIVPPAEDKPEVVPPTEDKPEVNPPAEDKPEVNPPAEDKPEVNPPTEDKPEVNPPTEDKPELENSTIVNVDKGESVLYNPNKPTNIKIVSSKLANKDVDYILVNGIKITKNKIIGKLEGRASNEYFTTSNGSITLNTKLFEELNLDTKENYKIGVVFTDGTEISNLTTLKVVNTGNMVTKPSEDNKQNDSTTNNKENNSTTTKVEKDTELPKTGVPAASAVSLAFAAISSFVGTVVFRKKK